MNKIHVLSDVLANQIAAGEVVEHPASVVKELLENSIDAGSTRIGIEIELGGRRLMRITDNGEGMSRDDAVLAFERHATSKIRKPEDLGSIGTLGFRGEALASIASVAKVELLTKIDADDIATRVVIEGGRLADVIDAACDTGTTISVRDLFFNTPARRKFMRSEATENYHLASIVTHYALAHPEIAFSMTNNGRDVLRVTPAKDLRERAFQVFGGSLLESLLHVDGGRDYVARVTGFVSAPRERRTTRDAQYFFVNKRFVRDKTIAGGLIEGYRSILPHGVYPVAFLFLEMPLDEIDVNVHPAKTEVRFRRGEAVKDVIAEAVRSALSSAGIVPEPKLEREIAVVTSPPISPAVVEADHAEQFGIEFSFASHQSEQPPEQVEMETYSSIDRIAPLISIVDKAAAINGSSHTEISRPETVPTVVAEATRPADSMTAEPRSLDLPPVNSAAKLAKSVDIDSISGSRIKPIGQLHDSFIIAVDDEGLLLIDQHVAHERILFDKFRRGEIDRPIESQMLLLPETVDLTPAQAQAFELIEGDLTALGFGTMKLSGRTVAIKSVPTDLPGSETRNLFAEILDTIDAEKKGAPKTTFRDDIAASLACKAAIKINLTLTQEKMHWLIDKLLQTTSPTTCPHGRPVILRLSMKDIERGFHRT